MNLISHPRDTVGELRWVGNDAMGAGIAGVLDRPAVVD
jgi:hypothetical protein